MKIFDHRNTTDKKDKCPICGSNKDGKTVLIGIEGTEEGNNMQAKQVHLDCLNLRLRKEDKLIYQLIYQKFGQEKK